MLGAPGTTEVRASEFVGLVGFDWGVGTPPQPTSEAFGVRNAGAEKIVPGVDDRPVDVDGACAGSTNNCGSDGGDVQPTPRGSG